jgi:hypothetical protein
MGRVAWPPRRLVAAGVPHTLLRGGPWLLNIGSRASRLWWHLAALHSSQPAVQLRWTAGGRCSSRRWSSSMWAEWSGRQQRAFHNTNSSRLLASLALTTWGSRAAGVRRLQLVRLVGAPTQDPSSR